MKKLTALLITIFTLTACGTAPDEINDSQESTTDNISDTKTEITIGMPGYNSLIAPAITDFNNKSSDCVLEIIDYSKLVNDDNDSGEKAVNQLRMDLISGKAPDIIVLHPAYMADFVNTGAFTDMYELIDNCEGVKREDFLPNVLTGFEVDGKIPALSYSIKINTAAAKTKFVGNEAENWTPEQAMQAYTSMPDDMQFVYNSDANSLMQYMIGKSFKSCVNYLDYTCNFTDGKFADVLDFCRENPVKAEVTPDFETMNENEIDAYFNDITYAAALDRQLVSVIRISGIDQSLGNQIWGSFGGEDITYVGYPSEDGCGAYTEANWMFGINNTCMNKDGAWEFLNYLLSSSFQKDVNYENDGIPVIKTVIDELLTNKNPEDYTSIYSAGIDDGKISTDENHITEEAVQKLYNYILNVDIDPYFNFEVQNIINEDSAAVISGDMTGEECADIIQSRVSIYLNERK